MAEYAEKMQRLSKMLMATHFVKLLPDLLEKFVALTFKNGHASFSAKVLADENTMSVIADLMPCCEGGGYFMRYFSALIFLGSLCHSDVTFGSVKEPEVPSCPQKTECPETGPPETECTEKKE